MTPLLAVLESGDLTIIAFIVVLLLLLTGGAVFRSRQEMGLIRLERQMWELQQKMNALLKHQGIEVPTPEASDMSPELQLMAKDPHQKIAAIKLYREEHHGVGLADAKKRIEEFCKNGR